MLIPRLEAPILALAAATSLAGCIGGAYQYQTLDIEAFRGRAETQTQGRIRVSAAVPGRVETASIFGIDLYAQGIQPVWLEITNSGDALARYAPVSTDRDYFAPLEVAYMNRGGYDDDARESMNSRFRQLVLPRYIDPGETRSGFVLTHAAQGAKAFNVDVFSAGELHDFTFLLRVPGFQPDYARLDLQSIYTDGELVDYDPDALREPLRELPCCSGNQPDEASGEPVNIVLVGEPGELLWALLRAGWQEISTEEARRLKPQFLYGREQDATFQYETIGGDSVYELRFWKAPLKSGTDEVYVGQARHFYQWIGNVRRFDADVDNARNFAIQNLLYAQTIQSAAWLAGAEVIPVTSFWETLINTPYFTDGYRVVLWLSGEPVSLLDLQVRAWDEPPRWIRQ